VPTSWETADLGLLVHGGINQGKGLTRLFQGPNFIPKIWNATPNIQEKIWDVEAGSYPGHKVYR